MNFSDETRQQLGAFLRDPEGFVETLYGWLTAVSYDEDFPKEDNHELSLLHLYLIETNEGLRPLSDAIEWVRDALSQSAPQLGPTGASNSFVIASTGPSRIETFSNNDLEVVVAQSTH